MKEYKLELCKSQLDVVLEALEIYARVKLGQVNELEKLFDTDLDLNEEFDRLKYKVFPNLHRTGYYGVYSDNCPKDSKVAYDIYKSINYEFNKNNPNAGVSGDIPLFAEKYEVEIDELD